MYTEYSKWPSPLHFPTASVRAFVTRVRLAGRRDGLRGFLVTNHGVKELQAARTVEHAEGKAEKRLEFFFAQRAHFLVCFSCYPVHNGGYFFASCLLMGTIAALPWE